MTKSSKSAASVSARELLAVREDLLQDLKVDLRLDLEDLEAEDAAAVIGNLLKGIDNCSGALHNKCFFTKNFFYSNKTENEFSP